MKKKLLALSLAAGFATAAQAGVIIGTATYNGTTTTAATTMDATNATQLRFTPDGIGHILLVPYYTAQSGNATLLNLVNTDTINGKWVKVRFRGALNSDDVFDFQIFMSPGDVWTGTVAANASGVATMTTTDNSCTLPASVNQSFVTDRLPGDTAAKNAGTLEGYVEIFNMADMPPYTPTGSESIYEATKHNSTGVATCTASVLSVLATDLTVESTAAGLGFDTPTTGLMANWTIVNVPEASSWSGSAPALVAEVVTGTPGNGRFVGHPQTNSPATITAANSADPLLRTALVGGAFFDLPDLSTPYLTAAALAGGTGGEADRQASILTQSLNVQRVTNEYLTDPTIVAATSWIFSLPTRRYALGVDYSATTSTNKLVFNENVFRTTEASYAAGAFFGTATVANARIIATTTYTAPTNGTNITLSGDVTCIQLGTSAVSAFNRSETGLAGTGFVISPGSATTLEFCGEVTVLGFNNTSALAAAIATKNIDVGTFVDGWATIATPGLATTSSGTNGLPVLGGSFVKATNPGVAAGTSGNFGVSWDHRFTR